MPQVTVTDVAVRIPAVLPDIIPGYAAKTVGKITIQNIGSNAAEYSPRSGVTYGGAAGGLRLQANGNATQTVDGMYAICATGLSTTIAYEYI